jgi:hypothetical protein
MIHLALIVAAVLFLGWVVLMGLGLVATAFEESAGCGCMTLVVLAVIGVIILVIAF